MNQSNIIDKEKLMEWLERKERSCLYESDYGVVLLDLVREVESGKFAI